MRPRPSRLSAKAAVLAVLALTSCDPAGLGTGPPGANGPFAPLASGNPTDPGGPGNTGGASGSPGTPCPTSGPTGALGQCPAPPNGNGGASGGPGGTGSPSAGRHTTCIQIIRCISGCSDGDAACANACYDNGTRAAQEALDNLDRCAEDNGCRTSDCLRSRCPREVAVCEGTAPGPGGPGGAGGASGVPDHGYRCDAVGSIRVCKAGICQFLLVSGMAAATAEPTARVLAQSDCERAQHMAITSYSIGGSIASPFKTCAVTMCRPY